MAGSGVSIVFKNQATVRAAFRRFPQIFESEILAALELAAMVLVGRTAELAPKGTGEGGGNLYSSIAHDPPHAFGASWRVTYGTALAHGEVIEYGRRPGATRPPTLEIARWIWLKRSNFPGVETEEDAQRVAFVVARNIGKHGFRSGPKTGREGGTAWGMFEQAREEKKDEVREILRQARHRIARRVNAELASSGSSL